MRMNRPTSSEKHSCGAKKVTVIPLFVGKNAQTILVIHERRLLVHRAAIPP